MCGSILTLRSLPGYVSAMISRSPLKTLGAGLVLVVALIGDVRAQEVPELASPPDSVQGPGRISPGGAFARSLLVPGWGQASVGSYNRAAFYFTVDAASAWMILKSSKTHSSALRIADRIEAEAEAALIAGGITDPEEIAAALDANEVLAEARGLAGVRAQQREDWIAFGLFMLVFGGADAFVSAQLADFPEALETEIRASPQGGLEVGLSVRLPFH